MMPTSSEDETDSIKIKEEQDRPVAVLTNNQRGNVTTLTTKLAPDNLTIHSKAAVGELSDNYLNGIGDINQLDSSDLTPLIWAASYGQLPTLKLLIKKNALVNIEGKDGETALLLAAANGHHEVVEYLINNKANINHKDHFYSTALMFAAHRDHIHCVSILLEKGADMTITNLDDQNAFSIAVNRKNEKTQIVMERFILEKMQKMIQS